MRKIITLGSILALVACSPGQPSEADQSGSAETADNASVCEAFEASIDRNLRGRMYQKIRRGGWDDYETGRVINTEFNSDLALILQLMDHHGCELPTEVPTDLIYNAEGAECVEALGTPQENDECYPFDWVANKGETAPADDSSLPDQRDE